MNITKDQIVYWLNNNGIQSVSDQDLVNVMEQCFNDLSPKWVSVDEMLPQDDFSVIACVDDDVAESIFRVADDGSYWFDGLVGVTHWMPLPEPPK